MYGCSVSRADVSDVVGSPPETCILRLLLSFSASQETVMPAAEMREHCTNQGPC